MSKPAPRAERGPRFLENWNHYVAGKPMTSAVEIPIYSDGHVAGQVAESPKLGPYQLINALAGDTRPGNLQPVLYLCLSNHFPVQPGLPDLSTEDYSVHHGGSIADEVVSLVTLSIGIRLWAGGITRHFLSSEDIRGTPQGEPRHKTPFLPVLRQEPLVPTACGARMLGEVSVLAGVGSMSPESAVALVRASRLYQQALWIADAEPQLSWLLHVSALETAALDWATSPFSSWEEILRARKPDLVRRLERHSSGPEAIQAVADEFAPTMQVTAKFLSFCKAFLPKPPQDRPSEKAQVDWDPPAIGQSLEVIYKQRSRFLHAGTPFPPPMLQPPTTHESWPAPAEKPVHSATWTDGSVFHAESYPMYLNTFSHIVRGTLQNWAKKVQNENDTTGTQS